MVYEFDRNEKTIKASGCWTGNKYDINASTILTKLIQQVGRLCDRYASDLFIDWKRVEQELTEFDGSPEETVVTDRVFGIRRDGVDGNTYVESRYTQEGRKADHNYRDIYLLRTTKRGKAVDMEFGLCGSIGYLNKLPW